MFCKNCGKEIAATAKFCSYCGCENSTSNNTHSSVNNAHATQGTTQSKEKKKTTKIIIVLVAVIVGSLIGKYVFAPAMSGESDDSSNNQSQTEIKNDFTFDNIYDVNDNTNDISTINSSYSEIFTSRYMVDTPTLFIGYTTDCFAKVEEGGHIIKLAYGHKDDIVYEMEQTIFYDIAKMTETEKNNLISTVKGNMSDFENSSACKITYNEDPSYFVLTVSFSDLDQSGNLQEAQKLMGNTGKNGNYFSMSKTEDALLNKGFAKK